LVIFHRKLRLPPIKDSESSFTYSFKLIYVKIKFIQVPIEVKQIKLDEIHFGIVRQHKIKERTTRSIEGETLRNVGLYNLTE
jgi:hypothetical protein